MNAIVGELEADEAQATMRKIAARQRGSLVVYYGFTFLVILGGWGAGEGLGYGLRWVFKGRAPAVLDPSLLGLLGLILGYLAYIRLYRPFIVGRFRQKMAQRGLRTRFGYALKFDDHGVTQIAGDLVKTAPWPTVTEIFRASDYWVFLVQMEPWVAPTRFFASAADEEAFVRSAIAHLSDGARDRSKAAIAFAAS